MSAMTCKAGASHARLAWLLGYPSFDEAVESVSPVSINLCLIDTI